MPRSLFAVSHRYALALLCLSLLAAAGGIFWYSRAAANAAPNDASASSAGWADAPADDAQSGSGILLGLARDAMRDGRQLAPADSNAWEFYLSVLPLEPQNRVV
jgi:protein TonB